MSLVRNAVESKVEVNVDYKVLKDFLNIVKSFEDSVGVVNFSDSLMRSTDGYTASWVNHEMLKNISVNVSRSELVKLSKQFPKVKEGIVKIVVEASIEKIKQDKVTIFVNNALIGSFLQPVEMVFPDLDRALNNMKFDNLISLSEYSKKAFIKQLKDLKKELGSKLFKDYVLDINTSRNSFKITPVLKNKYAIKHNETPIFMNTFFIDILNVTDVEFSINANKLLNYLANSTSKTVEIELNKGMDYVNDIEMFTCAKFDDNTFIMLCRK